MKQKRLQEVPAAANQLGSLVAVHEVNGIRLWIGLLVWSFTCGGFFALAVFLILLSLGAEVDAMWWRAGFLGISLLLLGLASRCGLILWRAIGHLGLRVQVFSDGLAWSRFGKARFVRWKEIAGLAVWGAYQPDGVDVAASAAGAALGWGWFGGMGPISRLEDLVGGRPLLLLHLNDRRTIVLGSFLCDLGKLGEVIRRRSHQQPQLKESWLGWV